MLGEARSSAGSVGMAALQRIYRYQELADKVILAVAALLFIGGVVSACLGLAFRSVPTLPTLTWTAELTRYASIASVFLVGGMGIRKGTQISVTLVPEKLPYVLFRILTVVNCALMGAFFCFLMYYGYQAALLGSAQSSPGLGISMFYPYLVLPVAAALMLVEVLVKALEALLDVAPRPNEGRDIAPVEGEG